MVRQEHHALKGRLIMKFSPQRLREAREAVGLPRAEVGRRINRATGTVLRYEDGSITPTVDVLGDLADVYGVAVDSLYDPADLTDEVTKFEAELAALIAQAPALTADVKSRLRALLGRGAA